MKKVIVITGGSEGLGKSIAEKLLENEMKKTNQRNRENNI